MRILLAEDNPTLARSVAQGLRDEGYAVDVSENGIEAAFLAKINEYDCILLDLGLPGRGGLDVLEELRARGSTVPVLCLTARDGLEDRVRGLDLGADDYLVKPFDWAELVARVRALIRRTHGIGSSIIRVGDLELDTAARVVRRDGVEIELSAREYALLRYMATRAGEVVTRTDVWEHLYDQNDQTSSNVVDVYIGYLRNKVDRPFPDRPPLIHTRRGLGYMLRAPANADGRAEATNRASEAR